MDIAIGAPPPIACNTLKVIKLRISLEKTHIILENIYIPIPINNIGFLPYLSERGPKTSVEIPKNKKNSINVKFIIVTDIPNSILIWGNAGRYISVVRGGYAFNKITKGTINLDLFIFTSFVY